MIARITSHVQGRRSLQRSARDSVSNNPADHHIHNIPDLLRCPRENPETGRGRSSLLLLAAQAAFVALTQLGLPSAATRFISGNIGKGDRQTSGAVARTILRLSILVGAAGFVIAALVSPLIGPSVIGWSDSGILIILIFFSGVLVVFVLLYCHYFICMCIFA